MTDKLTWDDVNIDAMIGVEILDGEILSYWEPGVIKHIRTPEGKTHHANGDRVNQFDNYSGSIELAFKVVEALRDQYFFSVTAQEVGYCAFFKLSENLHNNEDGEFIPFHKMGMNRNPAKAICIAAIKTLPDYESLAKNRYAYPVERCAEKIYSDSHDSD